MPSLYLRNTSKDEALDGKHFAIFLLKVICDASSRLVIFGAWMFTYNSWVFSTNLTVAYFYGMLAIMFMVNVKFDLDKERILSLRNLIGKHVISKTIILIESLYLQAFF